MNDNERSSIFGGSHFDLSCVSEVETDGVVIWHKYSTLGNIIVTITTQPYDDTKRPTIHHTSMPLRTASERNARKGKGDQESISTHESDLWEN